MESNGPTISAQVVVGQANRPKQYPGRVCFQHPLVDETGEKLLARGVICVSSTNRTLFAKTHPCSFLYELP